MASGNESEAGKSDGKHYEKVILNEKHCGGPLGHGDPEDQTLRKVEKDVLVGMVIRERSREEKCSSEYNAFRACGKATGLSIVFKCREENAAMQRCYEKWYVDPEFVKECTEQYLRERTEFRKDGIKHKKKKPGPIPDDILQRYIPDHKASTTDAKSSTKAG